MAELSAQTAASPDGPTAGAVPGNTTAGSSADSDLWRAVRQGDTFTSAKQDPLAGQLIQAEGHGWELTRNGPLAMYTAWALTGILILLSLFYALRGRVRIDAGPCGQTITRFGLLERASHWLLASTFIVLGLTGLNLLLGRTVLLPLIGHEAFAVMAMYGKYIHNYVGFAFTASVVIVFLLWVQYNIPNFLDLKWIVRGGGLFGGGHPPARKFNAGQKLIFWTVVIGGGSLFASGWALMNPFETSMMGATFEKTAASPDGPTAGAVPGNTTAGSSADSDLWRAVRQGDTFTSAKQDPLAGQLIQAEGHGWELTRNGPLAMYTAWALTGILILLSLFYALRGRVRIDAGPCGQTITRFGLLERASHWLLASTFIVLGLTGLNLLLGRTVLLPLIGHEAFAVMAMYGKYIHNYVGFAFTASVVIVFLLWVQYNIPNFLDLKWIVRGGGLFGGGHPPARKFNAGQKLIFWTVVIGGGSLFAS
ncbi:Formate dehydrogenase, partial [Durusdinium trenchii]